MSNICELDTIADGLADSIEDGSLALEMAGIGADIIILVSEGEIEDALRWCIVGLGEEIQASGDVASAESR